MPYLLLLSEEEETGRSNCITGAMPSPILCNNDLSRLRGRVYKVLKKVEAGQKTPSMAQLPEVLIPMQTSESLSELKESCQKAIVGNRPLRNENQELPLTKSMELTNAMDTQQKVRRNQIGAENRGGTKQSSCATLSAHNEATMLNNESKAGMTKKQHLNATMIPSRMVTIRTPTPLNVSNKDDLDLFSEPKEDIKSEAPDMLNLLKAKLPYLRTRSHSFGSKRKLSFVGEVPGLPAGWLLTRWKRTGGARQGRTDTIIYSNTGLRFKSMVEIDNFQKAKIILGGDEKSAFLYRRNLEKLYENISMGSTTNVKGLL